MTPCDVKRAKPDPEAILLAAEQLSVSPEQMVYVGDHLRDIQAGNAAGCFTSLSATVTLKIMMIPDRGVRTFTQRHLPTSVLG